MITIKDYRDKYFDGSSEKLAEHLAANNTQGKNYWRQTVDRYIKKGDWFVYEGNVYQLKVEIKDGTAPDHQ